MKIISLIVPVYKKEEIIVSCITKQLDALKEASIKRGFDYEIIAVIDGKLDNSGKVLREANIPKVKILEYKHNRGKGFAVRFGMMQAEGDFIGFLDAGFDIDPIVIENLIDAITKTEDTHIVVASKKHEGSKLVYPLKRKLYTSGYAIFVKLFTGIKYNDTQVGAKMFTRELIDKVLPRILIKRFAFDVELLAVAAELGYKSHTDVPINIDFGVDISSATNIKQILHMIWDTMAVGYRLRILKYYKDSNHNKWHDTLYDLLSRDATKNY